MKKAHRALKQIQKESRSGNISIEKLDLASLSSVKEFANRISTSQNRIDILINNAGNYKIINLIFF